MLDIEITIMGEASFVPTNNSAVASHQSQQYPSEPCLQVTIFVSPKLVVKKTHAEVQLPELN
ncbi:MULTISPECIES: hypothetical protein [Chroococcidiopsis]|jgi:hypothetical protein|uniref:Uncharacterized protein n=1 Tax=Chroococcidiopsis thermalis (strain PCC 7203) TaxID=251229 RepID=K9TW40_CHRTP|nr:MULTISPECIES: hypothetical protein [Chroococcidiopsis]AFY86386.1 hypothetical protein Chro_0844 [Chroococcidiopsis thermalis PCC 7203]PSB45026.1 hypothetical protein C7B80_18460 [Cyanosarcina cf. burmensis CCALA 770]URD51244.1 hypothetical protein M5J74_04480 [Chroococcidiopsis sp. CCNUC1]